MSIELRCVEPGHTDKRWLLNLSDAVAVLSTAAGEEVARFSPRDAQDRFRFPGLAAAERHFGIAFDEQTVRFDVQPRDLHAIEKFLMPGAAESVPLSVRPLTQARVGTPARAAGTAQAVAPAKKAVAPARRVAPPKPVAPARAVARARAVAPARPAVSSPSEPRIISISTYEAPILPEDTPGRVPRSVRLAVGIFAIISGIAQLFWLVRGVFVGFTSPTQPIVFVGAFLFSVVIAFLCLRRGRSDEWHDGIGEG